MESGGSVAAASAAGGRSSASNGGLGSRMETAAVTVSPIPSSAASVSVPIELVQAAAGIRPTITTTQAGGGHHIHHGHHGHQILSASPPPQPGQHDLSTTAVYVDANGDLVAQSGIQLTTITVAVPAPLSPSDPALLQAAANAAAAGTSHLPPAVLPHLSPSHLPPPPLHSTTTVALPTVPAPQETALKWKYEQSKDKTSTTGGSSLVRTKKERKSEVDPNQRGKGTDRPGDRPLARSRSSSWRGVPFRSQCPWFRARASGELPQLSENTADAAVRYSAATARH